MNEEKTAGRKPDMRAYIVKDGKGKGYWTPIGAAWVHKDGKGFDLIAEAFPLDGRLVVRAIEEKTSEEGGEE